MNLKINDFILHSHDDLMKNSLLLLHLALFSFGYSMATFSLPPFLTILGANQLLLGEYGFLLMLPNVILPFFFLKIKNIDTVSKMIIIASFMVDIPILFFFNEKSFTLLLFLVLILGTGQFIWWISTEIFFTGISKGTNLINIYSIVWGTSYFISPLVAGYLIPIIGYSFIFILSFLFVLFSIFSFIISAKGERFGSLSTPLNEMEGKVLIESFLPSFATGLSIGILFSIFPGFALHNGIDIFELGILSSAYSITRLIGFFYLGKIMDLKKLRFLMNISFVILLVIIVPAITMDFYYLLMMMLLVGFSSSLGISAPLIYISNVRNASITKNIAIYEFSFGISVSVFALVFGYISQNIGVKVPYVLDFIITVVLTLIFISQKFKYK